MNLLDKVFRKKKPARRHIRDVKPGELIRTEWYRFHGNIGVCKCLNNDPKTQKIFLQIKWSNYKELGLEEYELLIIGYNDSMLRNFALLNPVVTQKEIDVVSELQSRVANALENEQYEVVSDLKRKIEKIFRPDIKN